MRAIRGYFGRVLISLDQTLNTVLGGFEDETFSSRMGRRRKNKDAGAAVVCVVLDALQDKHCEMSIEETQDGEIDSHHSGRVIRELPRDNPRLYKVPKAGVLIAALVLFMVG